MALVEVDEAELGNLRQLQDIWNKGLQHPKARPLLLEGAAEVEPRVANAPDRMLRQEMAEGHKANRALIEEFIAESRKDREERQQNEQVARLSRELSEGRKALRARGYTDDGIKIIEEFKAERGILDYEDAVAAYEYRNPPPTPIATGGTRWDFLNVPEAEAPDLKPLFEGNEEGWTNKAIQSVLKDVRS